MSSNKFVFSGHSENKENQPNVWCAKPFVTLSNRWMEFNETWEEANYLYSTSSTKFVCFGEIIISIIYVPF